MKASITLASAFALASIVSGCAVAPQDREQEAAPAEATAQTAEAIIESTPRLEALEGLSLDSIEALYVSGNTEGGLPEGKGIGKALFTGLPGLTALEEQLRQAGLPTARTAEDFFANNIWHGKVFHAVAGDPSRIGTLTNDVFGLQIATADIHFIGASTNPDEANTFYLDYSQSSLFLVRTIQDYIRKIDTNLYIGKAFITLPGAKDRILGCYFALDFTK